MYSLIEKKLDGRRTVGYVCRDDKLGRIFYRGIVDILVVLSQKGNIFEYDFSIYD